MRGKREEVKLHNILEEELFYFNLFKIDPTISLINDFEVWHNKEGISIRKEIKLLQQSEKDNYLNDYKENHLIDSLIEKEFTKEIHLSSVFILTYGLYEKFLVDIVNQIKKFHNISLSLNDIRGEGYLGKCQKYFKKVALIDLSKNELIWKKIKDYQLIRNKIVHNHNKMPVDVQINRLLELNKLKGMTICNKTRDIQINEKEFIIEFTKVFNNYLESLIEIIENR